MTQVEITANEMADEFGINQKSLRRALRNEENLSWHVRYERWTVRRGSEVQNCQNPQNRLATHISATTQIGCEMGCSRQLSPAAEEASPHVAIRGYTRL